MEKRMFKYIASILLILTMCVLLGMHKGEQQNLEMVTLVHTVGQGETLWDIGEKYITPDRYMPEFIEGIYERNYDKVFAKREKNGSARKSVYPGDELEIQYWK